MFTLNYKAIALYSGLAIWIGILVLILGCSSTTSGASSERTYALHGYKATEAQIKAYIRLSITKAGCELVKGLTAEELTNLMDASGEDNSQWQAFALRNNLPEISAETTREARVAANAMLLDECSRILV